MNKMMLFGFAGLLFSSVLRGQKLNFKSVINRSTDVYHIVLTGGDYERMVLIEPSARTHLDHVALSFGHSIDLHQSNTNSMSESTSSLPGNQSDSTRSRSSSISSLSSEGSHSAESISPARVLAASSQDESFKQIVWDENDKLSIYRVDETDNRKLLDAFRFEDFPTYDIEITSKGRIRLNINEEGLFWKDRQREVHALLAPIAARHVLRIATHRKYEKKYRRTFSTHKEAAKFDRKIQRLNKRRPLRRLVLKKLHRRETSKKKV